MANYTDKLTGNPNILIEQNIYDSAELMSFGRMNTMSDWREVPTLLCRYTEEPGGRRFYSLKACNAAEAQARGYRVVCPDLPCMALKTAKARRNAVLALVLADIETAETIGG